MTMIDKLLQLQSSIDATRQIYEQNKEKYKQTNFDNIQLQVDQLFLLQQDQQHQDTSLQDDQQTLQKICALERQVKLAHEYNYNKNQQEKGFRSPRVKQQLRCNRCQQQLDNSEALISSCPNCGAQIIYDIKTTGSKQEDPRKKFLEKLEEFEGCAEIPYFVVNYVNYVVLRLNDKYVADLALDPRSADSYTTIQIDFPVKFDKVIYKSRKDLTSQQLNQIDLMYVDQPSRKLLIPYYDVKILCGVLDMYRDDVHHLPFVSYKPDDVGPCVQTIHRHLYHQTNVFVSKEDQQFMVDIYMKYNNVIFSYGDCKNHPIMQQVIYYMISNYTRLAVYKPLLIYFKNTEVSKKIIKAIMAVAAPDVINAQPAVK